MWPTTVLTPDDWIAELRFADGTTGRLGISPHLNEEQALAKVHEVVTWRRQRRTLVDVVLRRRVHAFMHTKDMHPENQERLTR